ncbi:MAG: alginate export family protein [Alphaproteobacteria bacterium]|nr:alginate export family protein [Alphaproteobacteria bacterium]|tara:strand:+ start:182 stop:1435 length:1254 start_codon:yes stop_codon:yes gene_type:complete
MMAVSIGVIVVVLGVAVLSSAAIADEHRNVPPHARWIKSLQSTGIFFKQKYRYEHVNDDNATKHANVKTMRTEIGYASDIHRGVSGLIELENVEVLGNGDYNSTTNGRTRFATVVDAETTELKQSYLAFHQLPDTVIKAGRQRIFYDNQRFIGDIKFRQHHQSFDALSVSNESVPDLKLDYNYIKQVLRIFSTDNTASGTFNSNSHLLHGTYSGFDFAKISGYGYFLDFDDDSPTLSTQTLGLRGAGGTPLNDSFKLLYAGEFAHQTDRANHPNSVDLNYYMLEGGVSFKGLTLKLDYEVLEGDSTNGFQMALGTNHKFQGVADRYLTTQADGMEDLYGTVLYVIKDLGYIDKVVLWAMYHDFEAEDSSRDLGSEFDARAAVTVHKRFTLAVKYGDFQAGDFSADIQKLWLTLSYGF